MSRLIDADALELDMQDQWERNEICNSEWIDFRETLKRQPTIDLIYCKDCEHYAGEGMYCAWNVLTGDIGYCHHALPKGEREVTSEAD